MILVHAAGNEKIGIGNLVRCYALGLQLKRDFKNKVFIIFECHEKTLEFLNQDKIEIIRCHNNEETKKVIEKIKLENSIYICDILNMNGQMENFLRRQGITKIIHLNDNVGNDFSPDIIIDGDGFIKKWDNNKKIIQSPKYHIIKEDIVRNRPMSSWNKNKVSEILVSFGGADPGLYTEKLIKQLQGVTYLDLKFKIVIGPEFSLKRKNNIERGKNKHIIVFKNIKNISQIILESDLVVSLGGGIAYESMCLGVAPAAVPWKYMKKYVDKLDDIKLIKKISPHNMVNEILSFTKDIASIRKIANNGYVLIDGHAVKRISQLISEVWE